MSTFNHPNTAAAAAPSFQTLSSPENVRSIFYTNLILLGIQEHASQTTYNAPSPLDTSRNLPKSLLATSQIHAGKSRPQYQQPAQRQPQHILITSHGYGTNFSRPLELHKYVFAKGHQSTKALEFVLWFLFTRLDKAQARNRFKECWPVLDRHDAREFRNVAFKWLDELRKEGCFAVGHNIHPTKCHVAGLGLFLPTIRRSYLDDSIGERIERLVLVLSTYVLSQVAMDEVRRSEHSQSKQMSSLEHDQSAWDDDKVASDLVCKAPEIPQEEDSLFAMIDSYIVRRSEFFGQDMENQENTRRTWSSKSNEMSVKLQTLAKELTKVEAERQTQQSLLAKLSRQSPSRTAKTYGQSKVDSTSILKIWERSLSAFERDSGITSLNNGDMTSKQMGSLETVRGLKRRLDYRLKETNRRVDRLQREQSVKQQPYRRLLSTIVVDDYGSNTLKGDTSIPSEKEHRDVLASTEHILSILKQSSSNYPPSSTRIRKLRKEVHQSIYLNKSQEQGQVRSLSLALKDRGMSGILAVQPPVATALLPAVKPQSGIRPTLAQTMRVFPHTFRPVQPAFNPMQSLGNFPRNAARPVIQSQSYELPPSLAVVSKALKKPVTPSNPLAIMGRPKTNASDAAPAASTSKAPTLAPIKSAFQQRLGISRKRRQSSDFQPERGVSSMFPAGKPIERSNHESEFIQQKELFNLFKVNAGEAPGTPSKRRRVDSLEQQLVGRRTSFGFDAEASTKGDIALQYDVAGSSAGHFPDPKLTRGIRSPKLTLDDLRAPTPKPLKTKGSESMTMPIMLLHTPQQKKLFEIDATPVPRPTLPFAAFTPPFAPDTMANLRAKSPKISLKSSAFSSSIFARFKTGVELQTDLDLPHADGRIRPISRQVPLTETSPSTESTPPRKGTATFTNSIMKTGRPKNLTTSTIVKHLLTRNSVGLDRVYGESKQLPDSPGPDDTIPRSETRTGYERDLTHKSHPAVPESTRISTEVRKSTLRESTMVTPAADLNANRNPWGRPPSWKPKSPRMIDMERKRQADRAHRLAAKNVGPMSLSLSQTPLGSLKVSVYGRASVSVPSTSSISFSSSSSLSSRSFHSDSSLSTSQSHGIAPEGSTHDDTPLEEHEDDDDTREFSPPPVSPIREAADSFQSIISARSQGITDSAQLTKSQFQIPTRSVRTYSSPAPVSPVNVASTVPIADTSVQRRRTEYLSSTTATVSQHQLHSDKLQQESDKKRVLEQPIQDDFFGGGKDEDETILNSALQPIFVSANRVEGQDMRDGHLEHGSFEQTEWDRRASMRSLTPSVAYNQGEDDSTGGLFDEMMPDALDPDEALWEITELFA